MQIFPCSLTVKTIKFKRNEYDDNKVETAIAGLNCWASYATGYNYSSWQIHDDLEVLLNNFSDTVVVYNGFISVCRSEVSVPSLLHCVTDDLHKD